MDEKFKKLIRIEWLDRDQVAKDLRKKLKELEAKKLKWN